MWSDRGHMQILLADDTAIYKQASNSTKSEIGVILISDTMGVLILMKDKDHSLSVV